MISNDSGSGALRSRCSPTVNCLASFGHGIPESYLLQPVQHSMFLLARSEVAVKGRGCVAWTARKTLRSLLGGALHSHQASGKGLVWHAQAWHTSSSFPGDRASAAVAVRHCTVPLAQRQLLLTACSCVLRLCASAECHCGHNATAAAALAATRRTRVGHQDVHPTGAAPCSTSHQAGLWLAGCAEQEAAAATAANCCREWKWECVRSWRVDSPPNFASSVTIGEELAFF